MKLRQIEKILPAAYENKIVIHLVGPPGCGKTEWARTRAVDTIARHIGVVRAAMGFKEVHLTSYEAPDIRGFLMPVTEGKELVGKFTRPTVLPTHEDPDHGVLLLDEYSQAQNDVKVATSPLILDGVAGEGKLPDGWFIITTGNRLSDKSGVTKTPAHVENRRMEIHVGVDVRDWASDFAQPAGIHPLFIAGAMYLPGQLTEPQPTEGGPWCTLRSYTRFCQFVQTYVGTPDMVGPALKDDPIIMEAACGMIGRSAAAQMLGFLSVAGDVPTYAQVLKAPDVCAKMPSGRLDVLYATTQMVLSNAKADHADVLFEFATHLPKEFQSQMLSELIKKCGPKLVLNKKFAGWMSQPGNAQFVQATMGA